jgi:hypothetical protein
MLTSGRIGGLKERARLRSGKDRADTQVVPVRDRSCIVESHRGPARWSRAGLHLHPVSVAYGRRQVLMSQGLSNSGRVRSGMPVIVPHSKHPGAVARRYKTCRRCARRRVGAAGDSNCS